MFSLASVTVLQRRVSVGNHPEYRSFLEFSISNRGLMVSCVIPTTAFSLSHHCRFEITKRSKPKVVKQGTYSLNPFLRLVMVHAVITLFDSAGGRISYFNSPVSPKVDTAISALSRTSETAGWRVWAGLDASRYR